MCGIKCFLNENDKFFKSELKSALVKNTPLHTFSGIAIFFFHKQRSQSFHFAVELVLSPERDTSNKQNANIEHN